VKKLTKPAAYVAFALLAVLVSLYLTFPADAVGQRLAYEITKRSGGKYGITFGKVSLYRLSGVEAANVKLSAVGGDEPFDVTVDALRVRLKLLRLFLFDIALHAEVDLGEGEIAADVGRGAGEGAYNVELEIEDLTLTKPPVLPLMIGYPLDGRLAGKAEIQWSPDPKNAGGKASLTLHDASFGPAEIKGFSVPGMQLGQLDLALDLRAGRLRLASFQQKGGDLQLHAQASSVLRPQASSSSIDACFEVKPNDAFLAKNPNVKTAFELATVQFKKDSDGFLHLPMGGTLNRPRPRGGLCPKSRGDKPPADLPQDFTPEP